MIQLIEAPPRSGKSYMAVNYLVQFTKYDELYNEYILDNKVLIISNIEGLKIKHWDLSDSIASHIQDKDKRESLRKVDYKMWNMTPDEKLEVLKSFFSIQNFEKIMEKTGKNHVILCIDECHDFFPAGFNNNDIYSFFAYHGHIGLDIVLMCQSLVATSRMFNPLLEFVVKVTPRSRSILNNFSYSYVDIRGRFLYSKSIPKKQLVFNAYKSFRKDEQSKPKNAVKHWIVITCVFLLISGLCFKTALAIVKGKSEAPQKKQLKSGVVPDSTIKPNSPVVVPASSPTPALSSLPPVPPPTPVPINNVTTVNPQVATSASPYGPPDLAGRVAQNSPASSALMGATNMITGQNVSVITVKGIVSASDGGKFHYLLSDGSIAESKKKYRLHQLFAE